MSSNIQIQRICQHCGNEFTARTTVTRLCSPKCRKADYKARKRSEKIEKATQETAAARNKPLIDIKEKEFLNVREVATLVGCSRRTAYRLIQNGTLKGVNLAERLTRVQRSEINGLFQQPKKQKPQPKKYDVSECLTITETLSEFSISEKALYDVIKRNNIPKMKKGKFIYIPKERISQVLT